MSMLRRNRIDSLAELAAGENGNVMDELKTMKRESAWRDSCN